MALDTCWTLVLGAAAGEAEARELFAARYEPVIRAYLGARWRSHRWQLAIPDAVQEVFVEVYKDGGLLDKVEPGHPGGFRAFLFGAVRRVAHRIEEGRHQARENTLPTGHDSGTDPHLSRVFDRAFAQAMMRQAAARQARTAEGDEDRTRRVELLSLRFQEGLAVREIAGRWGEPPERVHKAYAKAREEFRGALMEVLREHQEGTAVELEERVQELLGALD